MKRRVLLIAAAATALATLSGPVSAIVSRSTGDNGYWGCVGSYTIDQSICIKDPVAQLPTPEIPRLPL